MKTIDNPHTTKNGKQPKMPQPSSIADQIESSNSSANSSKMRNVVTIILFILSIMLIFGDKAKTSTIISTPSKQDERQSTTISSHQTNSPRLSNHPIGQNSPPPTPISKQIKQKYFFHYPANEEKPSSPSFDDNDDENNNNNLFEDNDVRERREHYIRVQKEKEASVRDLDDGSPVFNLPPLNSSTNIINKWILLDKKQATSWFRSQFGDRWKCGIARDVITVDYRHDDEDLIASISSSPRKQHQQGDTTNNNKNKNTAVSNTVSAAIEEEFKKSKVRESFQTLEEEYAKQLSLYKISSPSQSFKKEQDAFAPAVSSFMPWYTTTTIPTTTPQSPAAPARQFMFYSLCSPRGGNTRPFYFSSSSSSSISVNSFRLRSVTTPALGLGCLRKMMIVDGSTSSSSSDSPSSASVVVDSPSPLARSMIKRCFLPPKSTSTTSSSPFVVGLGHSHTRYLFAMICMMANNSWCAHFTGIKTARVPLYPTDLFDSFFLKPSDVSTVDKKKLHSTQHQKRKQDVFNNIFGRGVGGEENIINNGDDETTNAGFVAEDTIASLLSLSNAETTILNPQLRHQPLRMAYTASYYDTRLSFFKFLTWVQAHVTPTKHYISPALNNLHAKRQEKDKTDWGTDLGEDRVAENDKFDDELIDWVRNEKDSVFSSSFSSSSSSSSAQQVQQFVSPTHFIVSRGEWDMLYFNPNPVAMTKQITRALKVISQSFPNARLIFQLPQKHYQIPSVRRAHSSHDKKVNRESAWRNQCSSDERILILRHSCICASWRHHRHQQQNRESKNILKNNSNNKNLILFDSDELTRSDFGKTFVDVTGHHYIDEALEVMASEMLRLIYRDAVADEFAKRTEKFLDRVGEESCKFIDDAGKQFEQGEKKGANGICTCHRDSQMDPGFCKKVRVLPRTIG